MPRGQKKNFSGEEAMCNTLSIQKRKRICTVHKKKLIRENSGIAPAASHLI
jgi:hypothetical protein